MRVQVLNIYFGRETIGTGIVSHQLAEALAAAGHSVDVVTTTADYGALVPRTIRRGEDRDPAIRVLRIPGPFAVRRSLLRRLLLYGAFLVASGPVALACRRPDVAVVVTPPSIAAVPGALAAILRGVPLVIDAEDLYSMNALRPSAATRANGVIERWLIRRATRVRVLSDALKKAVDTWTGSPEKSLAIPVWADRQDIVAGTDGASFRSRHALEGRFVVLHAGNVGILGGQACVLDAAERLRGDPEVRFVFLGGGYGANGLQEEADRRGLGNILFIERVPRPSLSEAIGAADVGLATLDPRIGVGSVPSKIFSYMAGAKPVIAALDAGNPGAIAVRSGECGWVVPPGCGESLAEAIAEARRLGRDGRMELGARGLRLAARSHDRSTCLATFVSAIEGAAGERRLSRGAAP